MLSAMYNVNALILVKQLFEFNKIMEQRITFLLEQTTGSNVNAAEAELTSLSGSDLFIPSLVSIVCDSNCTDIVRSSAIIHLQYIAIKLFENKGYDDAKKLIKSSLVKIIKTNSSKSLTKILNHFVNKVIKAIFKNNEDIWFDLVLIIQELFNNGDVKVGLILSRALCGVFVFVKNNELIKLGVDFINMIVVIIDQLFQQTDQIDLLGLGYSCARRILLSCGLPLDYDAISAHFLSLVKRSCILNGIENTDEYLNYLYISLKFSIAFISKYSKQLDIEFVGSYLEMFTTLIQMNLLPKYVCTLLNFLSRLIDVPCTLELLSSNLMGFLKGIMLPLFSLTEEELYLSENDPSTFISEVHKLGNSFEDIRSSASNIIYYLSQKHDDVTECVRCIAVESFNWFIGLQNKDKFSQGILYSSFYMFSVVSKFLSDIEPKLLRNFISTTSILFTANETISRASIFMLLMRSAESGALSNNPDLIMICIQDIINDPSILVKYYATISVSKLLQHFEETNIIRADFIPLIPTLFQTVFQLLTKFQNSDLVPVISSFIQVFSNDISSIINDLGNELLLLLADSILSEEISSEVINSIENLIDIIKDKNISSLVEPNLFMKCIEILKICEDTSIFDLFTMTVKRLLENIPFSDNFWNIVDIIIQKINQESEISITDLIDIISILIYKDDNFTKKTEICSTIIKFIMEQLKKADDDSTVWNEYAKVASSLLMRLRDQSSIINEITPLLIKMLIGQIEKSSDGFSDDIGLKTLLNVLLFIVPDQINSLCDESIIEYWLENPIFPETVVSSLNCYQMFSNNRTCQIRILTTLAELLCNDILLKDPDIDDFDQLADCQSIVIWFDFSQTLLSVYDFFSMISKSDPSIYNEFIQNIPEHYISLMETIPKVAELYHQTSQRK